MERRCFMDVGSGTDNSYLFLPLFNYPHVHVHTIHVPTCTYNTCISLPFFTIYIFTLPTISQTMFFTLCIFLSSSNSRSRDTLLGETGDPCELFVSDDCDNNPLGAIMGKVNVSHAHSLLATPIFI